MLLLTPSSGLVKLFKINGALNTAAASADGLQEEKK
jgi:hypothetical protein